MMNYIIYCKLYIYVKFNFYLCYLGYNIIWGSLSFKNCEIFLSYVIML